MQAEQHFKMNVDPERDGESMIVLVLLTGMYRKVSANIFSLFFLTVLAQRILLNRSTWST